MNTPPGRIVALRLCTATRAPMGGPAEAVARADFGLEGDRHARPGSRRQVLLVDAAVLRAEGLQPGDLRENVTVEGLPVDGLPVGTRLRIGAGVLLRVTKNCEPCSRMDEIRPGLQERLRGRRGTLTAVEAGGVIRVGDAILLA